MEANSTGGQGSRRAVAPSDDDDDDDEKEMCVVFDSHLKVYIYFSSRHTRHTI